MSNHAIDDILKAIHNAALEAQQLTEQQHMRQIARYFDKDGKPIMAKIQVPDMDSDEDGALRELNIPQMVLMPPTSIKIKEMTVEFEVKLNGFSEEDRKCWSVNKSKHTTKDGEKGAESAEDEETHKGPLNVNINSGLLGFGGTKAKISIKLEGTEPPEAILKINDHLIKTIP